MSGLPEVLSIAASLLSISSHLPEKAVDIEVEPVMMVNYGAPVIDLSGKTYENSSDQEDFKGATSVQEARVEHWEVAE